MAKKNEIVKSTIEVPAVLDVEQVRSNIYIVRGVPVMFDFDLARFYGIETKVLKQAVRRNLDSFPPDFMFIVPLKEFNSLNINMRSQIVTPKRGGLTVSLFAFTEQGVSMLAAVLKSKTAVATRVQIMRAFVAMHQMLTMGQLQGIEIGELRARIEKLEKLLEVNQESTRAIGEEVSRIYQAINALSAANQNPLPKIGFDADRYQD